MIEIIAVALGAAGLVGAPAAVAVARRLRNARDERAQVIAMGEGMGIEYVPGEDFDGYRADVVRERDRRARVASEKWHAEEREAGRRRDAKGRFL